MSFWPESLSLVSSADASRSYQIYEKRFFAVVSSKPIQKLSQQDAYSAVRWSAASKYGAQAVQFGVSLLLARLLAPEYFGLIGMATVVIGFAKTLKNVGFNAAIIQRDDIDHQLLSTIFWVNLAVCALITLVLLAISPVIGWMYQEDQVTMVAVLLSLNVTINSFATVPSALLQRHLAFKKLAIRELGGVFVSGATGITCALLGCGVWSLVAASIAMACTNVLLLNLVERFRPACVIDTVRLRECLKFGMNVTGFNIFNYLARNADNLIIGICLGPVALGYYSFAYKLMLLPRDTISRVVTRVLFPKLASLKNDDEGITKIYLKTCGVIAFITFPMMACLAVFAEPLVGMFLGEKWLPAVPVIQILAPVGAMQSIGSTRGQILLAKGRSEVMFYWTVVTGTLLVGSFLVGVPWGAVGVATAYFVVSSAIQIPNYLVAFRFVEGLTVSRFLGQLVLPLVLSVVMVLPALLLQFFGVQISFTMLAILLTAAVSIYLLLGFVTRCKACHDLLSLAGLAEASS